MLSLKKKTKTELPSQFTFPFEYTPHPLAVEAADEVKCFLRETGLDYPDGKFTEGKMFGVLVVTTDEKPSSSSPLFFLAAYSGTLDIDTGDYFVPSIYDLPRGSIPTDPVSSYELQMDIFHQYRLLNAKGERKDIIEIFEDYHSDTPTRRFFGTPRDAESRNRHKSHLPPAGTGECCAPKLLQYAYQHGLRPLCMGEFWWGASPKGEIRHHGRWYPACQSKCRPILSWMMQGLNVEQDPQIVRINEAAGHLQVVYEDDDIIAVNKPAGLLSVPSNFEAPNVDDIIREKYGITDTPVMIHRLDMDTSGIMLLSKTKEANKAIQEQFFRREIQKKYVALLYPEPSSPFPQEGRISLPLSHDPSDRPRQIVDHEHGKESITDFTILGTTDINGTEAIRIAFFPRTGRTHQLRVHAASNEGIGHPILGDPLYGPDDTDWATNERRFPRLYLQAVSIEFTHPTTGERVHLEVDEEF